MTRILTTADIRGHLDFITSLIELSEYSEKESGIIEKILNEDIQSMTFGSQFEENIISLIYHEITHFLDMTTTLWGLEYNARKILFIKNQILTTQRMDALDVFKLNVSEIEIHKDLIKQYVTNRKINLYACELKHHLIYHKDYGSLVMVDFFENASLALSVPFSMLSVLEANAISTEYLIRIKCALNQNKPQRTISLKLIEEDFNLLLNNDGLSEYNLILILLKKHFPFLKLNELLIFAKILIRYVLNISSMEISLISVLIKHTIVNQFIGNAIIKDMQRGMSRHLVLFKFIFMIYEYMKPNNAFKLNKQHDLKYNPRVFLKNFINEYIGHYLKTFEVAITREGEEQVYLDTLEESKHILDSSIILESCRTNRDLLKHKLESECNVKDLKLLNIFLNDLTALKLPNSINIDIEKYFDDNLSLINTIEKSFRESNMVKFHIHPNDVVYV